MIRIIFALALFLVEFAVAVPVPSRWRDRLCSHSHAEADQAFLKLYQYGPAAFRDLVWLLDRTEPYRGACLYDDYSATMEPFGTTTIRTAALYLFHSIFTRTLYRDIRDPILMRRTGGRATEDELRVLGAAYKRYVESIQDQPFTPNGKDPVLAATEFVWGSKSRGLPKSN